MTETAVKERPVTSRQIKVGDVPIGGGAQIAVQSMTNTMTYDVEATVQQVYDLNAAGADLVRVSVNGSKALEGFKQVVYRSPIPLIADIHFDYRMALGASDAGAACVRINPGNIGNDDRFRKVIEKCQENGTAMRIGVNSGSVEKRFWHLPKEEALVASALQKVEIAEGMDFFNFKVSLKASHVPEMVEANRKFREHSDAPLHLGVTEAGTKLNGAIKTAAGFGQLLPYGIGDTIRVSLAEDPVEEIPVAYQILSALDLRHRGPNVIACPSCARTLGFDVISMASKVEDALKGYEEHFTVAVMGCIVNGPGEARDADYGVAGGKDSGVIFAKGEPLRQVERDDIFDALFEEIEKDGRK
ncbi:4-hydroxy-3-methylbut-2-en-1-yl diphosphate synthase [Rubrobacter radiotolerans]|uniref:4-hydroxy-3-methylbut-2-en-1-yl diphosphate synthase (flavodoxin) n=1 Tax=Rubrobacter radiotolerans TaxID=42256 RepID=A0A023X3X1_RUBRA|nr:flavodoxin-dependent (E)-4-hydroxy-3-methylbut-2-enyl-diphosphate synthase [Rubrobacter radiotolerans]AHY46695.1 4-hydroxy-3-methylbut-2-en-1-yl diphosphate synthase [Rubrobacter radiotolerans]MDX5894102.1 flavodoxin-dependent (E)-4-hydroxy-3-methylbut-2-enyl-diphosphate synthase [Rubrobacter radiotolerans]SMC05200.1 4-hydroxy-3-methylbut-2-en-1-yl diphosphate synthase [Rubrobacter radiotolerans DSM 5868]